MIVDIFFENIERMFINSLKIKRISNEYLKCNLKNQLSNSSAWKIQLVGYHEFSWITV